MTLVTDPQPAGTGTFICCLLSEKSVMSLFNSGPVGKIKTVFGSVMLAQIWRNSSHEEIKQSSVLVLDTYI